jgi:hypothetical protein
MDYIARKDDTYSYFWTGAEILSITNGTQGPESLGNNANGVLCPFSGGPQGRVFRRITHFAPPCGRPLKGLLHFFPNSEARVTVG